MHRGEKILIIIYFFKWEDNYKYNKANVCGMNHKGLDLSIGFQTHKICICVLQLIVW